MIATSFKTGTLGSIALLSALSLLFLGSSSSHAKTDDSIDVVVGIENACDGSEVVELGFLPVWADSGMGVMLDPGGQAQATYVDFNIDDPIDCYGTAGFGQVEFTETGFRDVVALANSANIEDVTRETGITTTFECEYRPINLLSTPASSGGKYTCAGTGGSPTSIKLSILADSSVVQSYYKNTLSLTLLPAS